MYFQYPIEALARRRGTLAQVEFAREAKRALHDSDDVVSRPDGRGLAIFAANEEALAPTMNILRDRYGDLLEVRGPKVRVIPGEPPREPVMHVRVCSRREHAGAILQEVRSRHADVVEECFRDRLYILRAEAPMSALLGLPRRLHGITGDSAQLSIRLLRYAPVEPDGPRAA